MDKLLPYECGFSPFEDARKNFNVNYYLISILFIIFDLEISFLFPWVLHVHNFSQYFLMVVFIYILSFGFWYEWKKGGLDWRR
jgi:NADH-quinone oxidoreductase subunit A